ncbi:MAG TPA: patatin-like phospholipase family protein [Candidatus Saccharimonadales bacterium]|nr:patatin-like phospholipase family protein [Candidatus Saccharimonadales bacterium]
MSYKSSDSSPRHRKNRQVENVLILQGGGSLGAFSCGVFKALVKEQIKIDVVAGTSIGAINAAIIAGSKSGHPEIDLENFWLELAESSHEIIPDNYFFFYNWLNLQFEHQKFSSASTNAAIFGVPKMFLPRWNPIYMFQDEDYFKPRNWTYLYDNTPLVNTLKKYIDYQRLTPDAPQSNDASKIIAHALRLIITSVNVLTAEPLVFDSLHMPITSKHLLASSGYPNYGFPWTELKEGVYGWDGSLLSNTPVREVITASSRNDKNIFIVENYSRKIDRLPSNMTEVLDRAKDIMFSDKTQHSIKMTKIMTRQIRLIEQLYEYFEKSEEMKMLRDKDSKFDFISTDEIESIRKEYKKLVHNRGAEILSVTRILRNRIENPNVSKNADFSVKMVKQLITEGEQKALKSIKEFKTINEYDYRT